MKYVQTLNKVLAEMPEQFTSNNFADVARSYGIPNARIANGICAQFLHPRCIQIHGTRIWARRGSAILKDADVKPKQNTSDKDAAIALLKSLGYRIMKPITQYEEI
jgi:hypothetical protein